MILLLRTDAMEDVKKQNLAKQKAKTTCTDEGRMAETFARITLCFIMIVLCLSVTAFNFNT